MEGFDREYYNDLETLQEKAEYLKGFVEDFEYWWDFFEPYEEFNMKTRSPEDANVLMKGRLESMMDFYVDNNWGEDDENGTFEKQTGIPFEELEEGGGDNTYNWSWLFPTDLNFRWYSSPDGRTFLEVRLHLGGDVRGNYTGGWYKEFDDSTGEDERHEFAYDLTEGRNTISVTFNDGSKIQFNGQQSSDVNYFEVGDVSGYDTGQQNLFPEDEGVSEAGIAYEVWNLLDDKIKGGRGLDVDDFVDTLVDIY